MGMTATFVSPDVLTGSAHADLRCVDCHADALTLPVGAERTLRGLPREPHALRTLMHPAALPTTPWH